MSTDNWVGCLVLWPQLNRVMTALDWIVSCVWVIYTIELYQVISCDRSNYSIFPLQTIFNCNHDTIVTIVALFSCLRTLLYYDWLCVDSPMVVLEHWFFHDYALGEISLSEATFGWIRGGRCAPCITSLRNPDTILIRIRIQCSLSSLSSNNPSWSLHILIS